MFARYGPAATQEKLKNFPVCENRTTDILCTGARNNGPYVPSTPVCFILGERGILLTPTLTSFALLPSRKWEYSMFLLFGPIL